MIMCKLSKFFSLSEPCDDGHDNFLEFKLGEEDTFPLSLYGKLQISPRADVFKPTIPVSPFVSEEQTRSAFDDWDDEEVIMIRDPTNHNESKNCRSSEHKPKLFPLPTTFSTSSEQCSEHNSEILSTSPFQLPLLSSSGNTRLGHLSRRLRASSFSATSGFLKKEPSLNIGRGVAANFTIHSVLRPFSTRKMVGTNIPMPLERFSQESNDKQTSTQCNQLPESSDLTRSSIEQEVSNSVSNCALVDPQQELPSPPKDVHLCANTHVIALEEGNKLLQRESQTHTEYQDFKDEYDLKNAPISSHSHIPKLSSLDHCITPLCTSPTKPNSRCRRSFLLRTRLPPPTIPLPPAPNEDSRSPVQTDINCMSHPFKLSTQKAINNFQKRGSTLLANNAADTSQKESTLLLLEESKVAKSFEAIIKNCVFCEGIERNIVQNANVYLLVGGMTFSSSAEVLYSASDGSIPGNGLGRFVHDAIQNLESRRVKLMQYDDSNDVQIPYSDQKNCKLVSQSKSSTNSYVDSEETSSIEVKASEKHDSSRSDDSEYPELNYFTQSPKTDTFNELNLDDIFNVHEPLFHEDMPTIRPRLDRLPTNVSADSKYSDLDTRKEPPQYISHTGFATENQGANICLHTRTSLRRNAVQTLSIELPNRNPAWYPVILFMLRYNKLPSYFTQHHPHPSCSSQHYVLSYVRDECSWLEYWDLVGLCEENL